MHFKKFYFLLILLLTAGIVTAQTGDSVDLVCPLANGIVRVIRASDKNYEKTSEYGAIITSRTDTLVQAVHDAVVVISTKTEGEKYDIVLSHRGYYFWYTGITNPRVKERDKIKAGDIIGSYKPNDLLELLMFFKEEPVNPRKFLKCK